MKYICPFNNQMHKLEEEDFRNAALEKHDKPLKGNNDLLSITRYQIIKYQITRYQIVRYHKVWWTSIQSFAR